MEDKNKIKRLTTFFYIVVFYLLGLLLSSYYRPFIYSNKINDFGLADIGNNIVFIPGVYFLLLFIRNKPLWGIRKDIYYMLCGLILFEILSFFIKGIGTFDFKDIMALFIGAGITYLIMKNKKLPTNLSKIELDGKHIK